MCVEVRGIGNDFGVCGSQMLKSLNIVTHCMTRLADWLPALHTTLKYTSTKLHSLNMQALPSQDFIST